MQRHYSEQSQKELTMELLKTGKMSMKGIQKLIDIADFMDEEESYLMMKRLIVLLTEAEPGFYNMLKNKMIKLKDVFLQIDVKYIYKILQSFPPVDLYKLLTVLKTEELEKFCKYISEHKKNEIFDEVTFWKDKCSTNELANIKLKFLDMYEQLMEKKELPLNYKIALFKNTPCISNPKQIKPSVLLFTNKSCYIKDEKITLYVVAPSYAAERLEVNIYGHNGREFSDSVYVNEDGVAEISLSVSLKEGLYNLVLNKNKIVLGSSSLVIGENSCLSFTIKEIERKQISNKEIITLKVENKHLQFNAKYKAEVFCISCQNVIDGIMFDLKHGTGEFFIVTGKHHGPFLLNITSDKGNTSTVFIPETLDKILTEELFEIKTPEFVIPGENINLIFRLDMYKKAMVVLSDNIDFIKNLDFHISQSLTNELPAGDFGKINRNINASNFYLKTNSNYENKIYLLNGNEFNIPIPLDTDNKEVNIFIYVYYGNIWHKTHRVVPVQEKTSLYLDFPKYIGNLDKIDGRIRVISPQKSELLCKNGELKRYYLEGRDYKTVTLTQDEQIHIELLTDKDKIIMDWQNSDRDFKKQIFRFLRKGEKFNSKNRIFLYPDISHWVKEIFIQGLLNYPWGCGEQTAAKINAFVNLYSNYSNENPDFKNIYFKKIKSGLIRMNLFEKEPGFYSLWESGEPDIHATEMIYNHLSILYLYPIKELESFYKDKLDGIQKILLQKGRNISTFNRQDASSVLNKFSFQQDMVNGNNSNTKSYNQEEVDYILETVRLNQKDNSIYWDYKPDSQHTRYGSYIYQTCKNLEILYDADIQGVNAITDISRIKNTIKRNFFYTMLEKLNIISPQYEEQTLYNRIDVNDYLISTINSIGKSFINYMVGSTSDTTSFTHLIRKIWGEQKMQYKIKDHIIEPEDKMLVENIPVICESDIGIVMEEVTNVLDTPSESKFEIKADVLTGKIIPIGGIITAEIDCKNIPLDVPYLTLYLPGNVKIDEPGYHIIDEQTVQIPIQSRNKQRFQLRGIRKGIGQLIMQIQDMYRPDVQGIKNDIMLKVI